MIKITAFVTALSLALASCATVTAEEKKVSAVGAAFAACAKGDVGTVLDSGQTVLAAVIAVVSGIATDWAAELDAIAIKVGDDAVTCAIGAVKQVFGVVLLPATGSASTAAVSPDVAALFGRLDQYEAVLAARKALGKAYVGGGK